LVLPAGGSLYYLRYLCEEKFGDGNSITARKERVDALPNAEFLRDL